MSSLLRVRWPKPAGAAGAAVVVLASALLGACGGASPSGASTPSPGPTTWSAPPPGTPAAWTPTPGPPDVVLIGAGDICRLDNLSKAQKTAALVEARLAAQPAARVFTLGDNSNQSGTAAQYADCFDTTWGAFKDRIRPTIGNHDQVTERGAPYYAYFGQAAGPAGKGYYSYDAGPYWHVVVLNAICGKVSGGCGRDSPQEKWLKADLAANSGKHILAMWHAPEFSSGWHGSTTTYVTWWRDLYAVRAELVLSGHDHDYERFARQNPDGKADPNGIRQFVVGTGGASHSPLGVRRPNSEAWSSLTFGVLELTLRQHSYAWRFIPVAGSSFTDSGETDTH